MNSSLNDLKLVMVKANLLFLLDLAVYILFMNLFLFKLILSIFIFLVIFFLGPSSFHEFAFI